MAADFSCIPCNGEKCFHLPVAERRACSAERHACPYQVEVNPKDPEWLCRCCDVCSQQCSDNI